MDKNKNGVTIMDRYHKYIDSYVRYRENNKERKSQLNRKSNNDKLYRKKWIEANKKAFLSYKRKNNAKRRGMGFVALNNFFEGAVAHHINRDEVVFIPEIVHKSIFHNIHTGENMEIINSVALAYLELEKE